MISQRIVAAFKINIAGIINLFRGQAFRPLLVKPTIPARALIILSKFSDIQSAVKASSSDISI